MTFYRDEDARHEVAAAYGDRLVPWLFAHWAVRLLDVAQPGRSADVVDLACGTGLITGALLDRLGAQAHIHGVDLDPAGLAYASTATGGDDRVTWHEADASQLPIGSATIDVVVCNQGLQFFPDRATALAEVVRVLRPGGRLAIAVWGPLMANPWPAAMAAAIGEAFGEEERRATESVCGLGQPGEIGRLLAQAGFVEIEITEVEVVAAHSNVREAIDGQFAAVPSAALIDALGNDGRRNLIEAMAGLLGAFISADGVLSVPSTAFLASGVSP